MRVDDLVCEFPTVKLSPPVIETAGLLSSRSPELAAVMSRMSCPLVAVLDAPIGLRGVVTMAGSLKRKFTLWE